MATRVAFLWHMHQPMYTDPVSGEAILPWVRFHATHAYYDMARMLERHPQTRVTVNFVPCLLEQLQAAADGTSRERFLELSGRRPQDMTQEERAFVVRQFFMVDRERCIKPLPRYWELLQRRGEDPARATVDAFSDTDLRDLQVLFNLAWMGWAARADEKPVAALLTKGRLFDEDDKSVLLEAQQRILQRVVPLWKGLAASGQVELSSTPYFHPILPLLCDSDSARRAMPDATLPPRFVYPEDARMQVQRALERHAATFGARPAGMWPAEGSVSPEALAVLAEAGIQWIATDEEVLAKSVPAPTEPGQIYQPWSAEAGGRSIAIAFRDHALSDRIGFAYSRTKAAEAASDFVAQIERAEAEALRGGITDPLVAVVLDGENAWEHYEGSGEPFLDALYGALERRSNLKTATMSEALAEPSARISRIHSGSWIESSFRIWIGHPEDNLAWEMLGRVRALLAAHETRGDIERDRLDQARNLLLSAEGSDWFWWYGDDFETENAAEFDALFRDRLLRAAALLGEAAPARLRTPISARARRQRRPGSPVEPQTALISPAIDGHAESYLRWVGAGTFRPQGGRGAMYKGTRLASALRFAVDRTRLYLRLDLLDSVEGTELSLNIANGRGASREVTVPLARGRLVVPLPGATGVCEEVLEISLPLKEFQFSGGDQGQLSLLFSRGGVELDRLPSTGAVPFEVPGPDFALRAWFV